VGAVAPKKVDLTQAYAKYFGFPRDFIISSRIHMYSSVNWKMNNGLVKR
jgi:hypothetical protein